MPEFLRTVSRFFKNPFINPYFATVKHIGWQVRKITNHFPCDIRINNIKVRIGNRSIAMGGGALLNAMGYYDPNNMFFLEDVYKAGLYKCFFDVGSNIGIYSLIVASQSPEVKVLAIEPHPYTFERLVENITLNGLENRIISLNSALGSYNGLTLFSNDPGSYINHVVNRAIADTINVSVLRGDSSDVLSYNISPDVVKIDVEGYENQVLEGFGNVLDNVQMIFVECQNVESTAQLLRRHNFIGPFKIDYARRTFVNSNLHDEDWVFLNNRVEIDKFILSFQVE